MANLRGEPDERAERVSQLPIFTRVEIGEARGGWVWVRGPDGYGGWVKEAQISLGELPPPTWKVGVPWVQARRGKGQTALGFLPLDARVYGEEQGARVWLRWPNGEKGWVAKGALLPASWAGTFKDLLGLAQELVGVPYLWGGTTPFGFDCSGFVQRLFHFVFNVWLPRDSRDQQEAGQRVPEFSGLRPGDVLCFPGHVGLWLGEGRMVHASGRLGQVVVTELLADEPYARELRGKFLFGVRPVFRSAVETP